MLVAVSGPTTISASGEELVRGVVAALPAGTVLVSGGAYGVDTLAAESARERGLRVILAVPAGKWHNERLSEDLGCRVEEVPGGYMARNDRLAELADVLYAFPPTAREELRSGTWATVRRFRRLGKTVHLTPFDTVLPSC